MSAPRLWAPTPLNSQIRHIDRLVLPEGELVDIRIRFRGQKNFVRATKIQAEQAILLGLEVRADVVTQREVVNLPPTSNP